MALWVAVQVTGAQADVARMALLELRERPSMRAAIAFSELLDGLRENAERALVLSCDLESAIDRQRRSCGCPAVVAACNCPAAGGGR